MPVIIVNPIIKPYCRSTPLSRKLCQARKQTDAAQEVQSVWPPACQSKCFWVRLSASQRSGVNHAFRPSARVSGRCKFTLLISMNKMMCAVHCIHIISTRVMVFTGCSRAARKSDVSDDLSWHTMGCQISLGKGSHRLLSPSRSTCTPVLPRRELQSYSNTNTYGIHQSTTVVQGGKASQGPSRMATLKSKTVLVLGGSSGIGYAVAEASLKSHAALIIIASSSASRVEAAVKRLKAAKIGGGDVVGEVVDAKDISSVQDLFARVGEIDHLVFTSGGPLKLGFPGPDEISGWKDAFDVRFWGPTIVAQCAKIRSGGSITLTVGAVVVKPIKGWSIAAGVAGATDSLTRGLAIDLAPIRVNVVSPGFVNTELWNDVPEEQREIMFAAAADKLLVKRIANPEEIAEAYLFAMKCGYITGQRIEVDGGYVLGA